MVRRFLLSTEIHRLDQFTYVLSVPHGCRPYGCVILSRYLQISGLLWRKFSTVPSNFRRIRGSPDSFRLYDSSLRIADSASESGTRRAFAVAHEAPFMEAKTPSTNAKKARTYALVFAHYVHGQDAYALQ